MACDYNALLAQVGCLSCLEAKELRLIQIALLCNLSGVFVGDAAFLDFDTIAQLKAYTPTATMRYAMVDQETVVGDGTSGGWYWSPTSLAAGDNITVAKPNALTDLQQGRWIKHF